MSFLNTHPVPPQVLFKLISKKNYIIAYYKYFTIFYAWFEIMLFADD